MVMMGIAASVPGRPARATSVRPGGGVSAILDLTMSFPRAALPLLPLLAFAGLPPVARGQFTAPPRPQTVSNPVGTSTAVSPVVPESITPTWETQTDARTVYFEVPAPRGQIVDRNGQPLAQSRLGYHLDLSFPTGGQEMTDVQVVNFVKPQLVAAQALLRRPLELSTAEVLEHYKNRRVVPLDLAQYLSARGGRPPAPPPPSPALAPTRLPALLPPGRRRRPTSSATSARRAAPPTVRSQPNEAMWPNLEGREGLETRLQRRPHRQKRVSQP